MNLQYHNLILISAVFFLINACGNQNDESSSLENADDQSLTGQVQVLVDENRFEEALDLLRNEDESDREVAVLLRDTHLLYGNWLMYHAEEIHMTERMPMALAHFRRVLELDPQNPQARTNKQQIVEIYNSMGRNVPSGVAE